MSYPTKNDQKMYDLCNEYVAEAKRNGSIEDEGAAGPIGHLAVAVDNLLAAADAEIFTDAEVRSILRIAKLIVNLGFVE